VELSEDLESTDDDALQLKIFEEWADLLKRLPMKRNDKNHLECVLVMLDRMRDAGALIPERTEFLDQTAKGRPGAPRSADISIAALEKHLYGESFLDIAHDLCEQRNDNHACNAGCADRMRQRVNDLKRFFKKWHWEIERVSH
jgi:hypothetical protein